MDAPRPAAVIVLAAMELPEFRSRRPWPLHVLGGRTLLDRAIAAAAEAGAGRVVVVIPDDLRPDVAELAPQADVRAPGEPWLDDDAGDVVLLNANVAETGPHVIAEAMTEHYASTDEVTVYSRAHGIAVAPAARIRAGADDLALDGDITSVRALAEAEARRNRRTIEAWLDRGVRIVDPAATWIDDDVDLGVDVTLLPNTRLERATSIGDGATIGPDTTLRDVEVGEDATIIRAHGELAVIGARATVGPFAYVRPNTRLGEGAKIGTFVETKNADIAPGAKVPHLCYCGDAVIGEGANIGAGTIFANYDGANKSVTHVGAHSFIGSNSVLVAPVDIADGTYVAAGSAITDDVPAGSLAVARGRQHVSDGWVGRRKPGSKAAAAAQVAGGEVHPRVRASRDKLAGSDETPGGHA